jgi:hypothetical protein
MILKNCVLSGEMEDVYTATLLHYFNCQLDQILQDTRKNLGIIYLNCKFFITFIAMDLSRTLSVLNLILNKLILNSHLY